MAVAILLLSFIYLGSLSMLAHASPVVNAPPTNGTNQFLYLQRSSCNFYYIYNSSIQLYFSQCSSNGFYNTNWTACFQQCCNSQQSTISSYPSITQSALDYCSQVNQVQVDKMKIVIFVMACLVPVAVCIFLFIACKRRRQNRRLQLSKKNSGMISQVQSVEWQEEKEINGFGQKQVMWSSIAKKEEYQHTQQTCAICLEEGPLAELYCGHRYHPQCIRIWLEKHTLCPCCRLEGIRGIKVRCRQCLWMYYVGTRSYIVRTDLKEQTTECKECISIRNKLANHEQITITNMNDSVENFSPVFREEYTALKIRRPKKKIAEKQVFRQIIFI